MVCRRTPTLVVALCIGGIGASGLVAAGCGRDLAFACGDPSACLVDGVQGICAEGFCALPDGACPSGYRFVDESGPLAGSCTPVEGSTSDGEPGDVTSTTGITTSLSASESLGSSTAGPGGDDSSGTDSFETGDTWETGDESASESGDPVDCVDIDDDGFGVGSGCEALDCDDANPWTPGDRPCRYISPQGADGPNNGTEDVPWLTFEYALPRLTKGDSLVLLDGIYRPDDGEGVGETGTLGIQCSAEAGVRCEGGLECGSEAAPIRVRAKNEGRAYLAGNGDAPPVEVRDCEYWQLEGLVGRGSLGTTGDAHAVLVSQSREIELRRFNFYGANPAAQMSGGLYEIDFSRGVLLEECMGYDSPRRIFASWVSADVVFRRCYANGSAWSANARSGRAFYAVHGGAVTFENSIVEDAEVGFFAPGGFATPERTCEPGPVSEIELLGCVARQSDLAVTTDGFGVDAPFENCVDFTRGQRLTLRDVAIDGGGVSVDANAVVEIDRVTLTDGSIHLDNPDVASALLSPLQCSAGEWTGLECEFDVSCGSVGGCDVDISNAIISSVDAPVYTTGDLGSGSLGLDASVSSSSLFGGRAGPGQSPVVSVAPDGDSLDAISPCPVIVAAGSDQDLAGNGARIRSRYENGELRGDLPPLWNEATGAFPCGPEIDAAALGLDGVASSGCSTVHERLGVEPGQGCSAIP